MRHIRRFRYDLHDDAAGPVPVLRFVWLRVGYKKLHYKLEEGNKGTFDYRKLDTDIDGPFVGVGWTFPARKNRG